MNISNDKKNASNIWQKFFFAVFLLLVLVNPFPLGSNRVWAWSLEAMVASGLLMAIITCSVFSDTCVVWYRVKALKRELWLIGLWLLVNLLYLIPMPVFFLSFVSPTIASAYSDAGFLYGYLTLDVYASFKTLMLSVYYSLVFVLGVILVNTRKRIIIVMSLIIFLGLFESVYGMYLVSIGQTGLLVQVTSVTTNNASGTFINKNHLVAFLSMCFIIGLSLRLMISNKLKSHSHLGLKIKFIRFIGQPLRLLDFVLFLILAGIWNTHSRAGLASFLLSVLFFFALVIFVKKVKTFNYKSLLVGFALAVVLLILVADDVNYLMESLGAGSNNSINHVMNSAEGRLLAVNQVFEHYPKYWFSGVGPGAYEVFFVNHRVVEQTAFFDHAHNDFVEFIIEYGFFSVLLLLIAMNVIYKIFIFNLKTNSLFYKTLGFGVVSCVLYMLFHGNMDFNARIPANVVTLIVAISVIYGKIAMSNIDYERNK